MINYIINSTRKKILLLLIIILTVSTTLYYIRDAFHYYYPLTEYLSQPKQHTKQCNIIGKVQKIISSDKNHIYFTIYDKKSQLNIIYKGAIPRMFSLNQEIIATGIMNNEDENKNNKNKNNKNKNNDFIASRILVKHDETYSPFPQKKQ